MRLMAPLMLAAERRMTNLKSSLETSVMYSDKLSVAILRRVQRGSLSMETGK